MIQSFPTVTQICQWQFSFCLLKRVLGKNKFYLSQNKCTSTFNRIGSVEVASKLQANLVASETNCNLQFEFKAITFGSEILLHFSRENEIPITCLSDDLIDQNLEMLIT